MTKTPGWFMFEEDQADRTAYGENHLQFMTSELEDWSEVDEPSGNHYDDVENLLRSSFLTLEVGASESLHIIPDCDPANHVATTNRLRQIFCQAGWVEA